uniref:Uncharacterized protein n=1 Tax=Tanacetum cinerariifolium TaxID=118510 RepID=A0A699GX51_TANCI|nr:hypothetical protein [Tanacetum cinerariifolium]
MTETEIDRNRPKRSKRVEIGQNRSKTDEIDRKRMKSVENGRNLSKTVEICRNRSKMVEIGRKQRKLVENGRNQSKTVDGDLRFNDYWDSGLKFVQKSTISTALPRPYSSGEKKMSLVNDVAVLFVMGYDEFTSREFCLHYFVSLSNVDDVIFPACIGKLNGVEIMRFNGMKAIESVPSLENVTVCFGMVIDEHFSSLVMRAVFYEQVKSIEIVNSLASEARLCCTLANLNAHLKN